MAHTTAGIPRHDAPVRHTRKAVPRQAVRVFLKTIREGRYLPLFLRKKTRSGRNFNENVCFLRAHAHTFVCIYAELFSETLSRRIGKGQAGGKASGKGRRWGSCRQEDPLFYERKSGESIWWTFCGKYAIISRETDRIIGWAREKPCARRSLYNMLELQHISFSAADGDTNKEILDDVSLTVSERFVAITGRTAAANRRLPR